jgi:hypothetical protein
MLISILESALGRLASERKETEGRWTPSKRPRYGREVCTEEQVLSTDANIFVS